jgi:hypothetical protein
MSHFARVLSVTYKIEWLETSIDSNPPVWKGETAAVAVRGHEDIDTRCLVEMGSGKWEVIQRGCVAVDPPPDLLEACKNGLAIIEAFQAKFGMECIEAVGGGQIGYCAAVGTLRAAIAKYEQPAVAGEGE